MKTIKNNAGYLQTEKISAFSEEYISSEILGGDDKERVAAEQGFFTYFEGRIRHLFIYGHEGLAEAYKSTLQSLKRYLGEKDLPFNEITPLLITGYRQWLFRSGVCKNTEGFYLHNLKAVYTSGCREFGLALASPFSGIKIKVEKTLKRSLSIQEIKAISRLSLQEGTAECLARDIFMFSLYARGMAFVDIAFLKKENISSGELWYKRRKTGQKIRIGINRQIRGLLEKYMIENRDYLFPLIEKDDSPYMDYKRSYYHMRYALKKISQSVGAESILRFHAARHSWAVIARESGAPIQTISECLGHSSEKITRIYLRDLDRSILDKLNDIVAEKIE